MTAGATDPTQPPAPLGTPAPPDAPAPAGSGTACPNCGEAAPAGAVFCEACGTDLGGGASGAPVVPGRVPTPAPVPTGQQSPTGLPTTELPTADLPTTQPVPRPACVSCGVAAVGPDGYCGSCGYKQPAVRDHMEMGQGAVVAVTDKGLRHHDNEDAAAIAPLSGGGAVLVVCDGVSSTAGSADASLAAADAACQLLVERLTADPGARVDDLLVEATAVAQARAAVVVAAPTTDPGKTGGSPSSTFVAAVGRPDGTRTRIDVAWVGDSRAYWVTADEATQLTDDHEIGGSLIRWLGADSIDPTPELFHLVAEEPGRLLVCSDGLWRYADPPPEMAHLVARLETDHRVPIDLARALVDHAIAGGGHDNISVAIWDTGQGQPTEGEQNEGEVSR